MNVLRRLRRPPYPIHGRSLGMMGTPREPYTWWDCGHGHQTMGGPWHPPEGVCHRCVYATSTRRLNGERIAEPVADWQPANLTTARSRTVEALDGKADLIARHDEGSAS